MNNKNCFILKHNLETYYVFSDNESPDLTIKVSFPLEPKTMEEDKPIYAGSDNCIFTDHPNHNIGNKKVIGELEYEKREGVYRIYKANRY